MDWSVYILIGFVGAGLFFVAAAWALHWAVKNGQFRSLDQGARTIFDEEEPEGVMTDAFPSRRHKRKNSGSQE